MTEGALTKCIIDIRQALGDDSRQPHFVKNIPRVGYRFIHPIEELWLNGSTNSLSFVTEETTSVEIEYTEGMSASTLSAAQSTVSAGLKRRWPIPSKRLALIVGTLLVLGAGGSYLRQTHRPASQPAIIAPLPGMPGKKPVVVMFFENQSNRQDLDWLREGLANMIITGLSRVENLAVLNRQQLYLSLQRTKPNSRDDFQLQDAFDVARRINLNFVVSGSFARLGDKYGSTPVSIIHTAAKSAWRKASSLIGLMKYWNRWIC